MRLAIISDIHGNLEAFQEVLADIESREVNDIICLGDNIGYGPQSNEVVLQIIALKIPCIMGNHEMALMDKRHLDWFNPTARESLLKTNDLLSDDAIRYIKHLKSFHVFFNCRFVHGFPPDSALMYLFQASDSQIRNIFGMINERICFVGHTHDLELITFDGNNVKRSPLYMGEKELRKDHPYIVNVGSVGQPRDGNNNAKYVIWDSTENTIDIRFVPYDVDAVANKIISAGLPRMHAERLR